MTQLQLATRGGKYGEPLLKRAGNLGLGFAAIVIIFVVIALFLHGMVWASEKVLPWLIYAGQVAFAICGFAFLPLCIFRRTRPWAGFGFFIASYVFGTELFAYSCIVAFQIWGYAGLIVGLFLGGIGVVPVALLAALYAAVWHRTQWGLSGDILLMLILTFGTRFLGLYLMRRDAPEPEPEVTLKSAPPASLQLAVSPPATPRDRSLPEIADEDIPF